MTKMKPVKYFTGEKFQICGLWIYDINIIADGVTILTSLMHTARAKAQGVHVWVCHIMPCIARFGTNFDFKNHNFRTMLHFTKLVNLVVRKHLDLHCYLENVMTLRN